MPDLDTAALRRLLDEATPGPWWVHRDQAEVVWYGNEAETYYLDEHAQEIQDDSRWDTWAESTGQLSHGDLRRAEDAALIAAAVNALPALLDAAEERDRLREEVMGHRMMRWPEEAHRLKQRADAAEAREARLRASVQSLADEWASQAASGVKIHCGRRLRALPEADQ